MTTLTTRIQRKLAQAHHAPAQRSKPTRKGAFPNRLTTGVLQQLSATMGQIERQHPQTEARHARTRRYLAIFAGDARKMLAAMALCTRPSTVATYANTIAAQQPELSASVKPYKIWAQRAQQTAWGRPVGATPFRPEGLVALLARIPPHLAAAVKLMWVSASRAADLQHFQVEPVQGVWRVTLATTEGTSRYDLRSPKGDRQARRTITKWLPMDPELHVFGPYPTWQEIDEATKFIDTTPHAIRRSAIQYLEGQGFSTREIATLSGHAAPQVRGIAAYQARLPMDPDAKTSLQLANALLKAIQSHTEAL